MILCSCNVLASAEMRKVAEQLRREAPDRSVTPGRLFLALGARPQCGGCVQLVRQTLLEWGFTQTCPEPLASIADDIALDPKTKIDWEMV